MSDIYLYIVIRLNTHGIWTALLGESFPDTENKIDDAVYPVSADDDKSHSNVNEESDSNERDTTAYGTNVDTKQTITFRTILSAEEWKSIRPKSVQYSRHSTKRPPLGTRHYQTVKRHVWSNVVNEHFWNQSCLPYASGYHACFVRSEDDFLTISGQCSFCYANLTGTIAAEPLDNEDVDVECR